MKKSIALLGLILFAMSAFSQGKFTAPVLTDVQKYHNAVNQWNYATVMMLSLAKSEGKTLKDAAKFLGDKVKVTWNKENGWEGFAKGMMYHFTCLAFGGTVQILEQSDTRVRFKVTHLQQLFEEMGSIDNITYDDYLDFFGEVCSNIGDYLDAAYTQRKNDDGIIVVIRKK